MGNITTVNGFPWPCFPNGTMVQEGDRVITKRGVIVVEKVSLSKDMWTVIGELAGRNNGQSDSVSGYEGIFLVKPIAEDAIRCRDCKYSSKSDIHPKGADYQQLRCTNVKSGHDHVSGSYTCPHGKKQTVKKNEQASVRNRKSNRSDSRLD